jgi:Kef-type K+ transport system membrane component KefB
MHAGLAAAIGISSSPAVILLVARELDARGVVTERALTLVAINNILAFFAFTALLPFLHYQSQAEWSTILLQPLYRLGMSLVVAYLLFQAALRIAFMIGQRESAQFALLVGVIITAIGAAKALNCSVLLTLLALGLMSRNLDREGRLLEVEFGHGGQIFFVLLFVVAGARLHFGELAAAGGAALAFVGARQAGKWLGVMLLARSSGLTLGQGNLLSLTLAPMAGMAIGLAQSASNMYPEFASTLSAIVLASVAILETVGPIATEFALKKAGEVDGNRQVDH